MTEAVLRQCNHCGRRLRKTRYKRCGDCILTLRRTGALPVLRYQLPRHQETGPCGCRSCAGKRGAAHRKPVVAQRRRDERAWADVEDAVLRELAGRLPVRLIARELETRWGHRRTHRAVYDRLHRALHLSGAVQGRGVNGVGWGFHVAPARVRWWIDQGWLRATQWRENWRPDQQEGHWYVQDEDVRAFIEQYPWAYYWPAIRIRAWRRHAEVVAQHQHWVTSKEAGDLLGFSDESVRRWARQGQIAGHLQHGRERQRSGVWVVDIYETRAYAEGRRSRGRKPDPGNSVHPVVHGGGGPAPGDHAAAHRPRPPGGDETVGGRGRHGSDHRHPDPGRAVPARDGRAGGQPAAARHRRTA